MDMDGRVLKDIFQEESDAAQREIAYQTAEDERGQIRRKLQRLKRNGKI